MKNIQLKTKIQLYILPLLMAYLFFNFYSNYFEEKNIKVESVVKNIQKEKKFQGNFIEIYSNIEIFCKTRNIDIINISRKKKNLKLLVKSNLHNTIELINYLENINTFSEIKKFDLTKETKKRYIYEIEVSFNKYYKKSLKPIFIKATDKEPKFILNAIIGQYVLINNKILTINEKIDGYILNQIIDNYAVLESRKEIIKLEFKDEKIK